MNYLMNLLLATALMAAQGLYAQEYSKEIAQYQQEMNTYFADPEKSPLTAADRADFKGLPFYEVQETYRVEAKFVATPNFESFAMKTTTDRAPMYRKYGEAHFSIDGKDYVLSLYQNMDLLKRMPFYNKLFVPFKDLSNGKGSYSGGRYLDVDIPKDDTVVLDFNKAYAPYCAYNYKYSCPIPPSENHLQVAIEAGVKTYKGH